MGVTGLWQILAPCARPTKLETLHRRRLAVDASIWIYQFLKAVRDKEGHALRNSHVVGFFRRICKLLYFGIKPVFVFDGGAPALKRATIAARRARREGRREDVGRTASKVLMVEMMKRAEMEAARRKRRRDVRGEGGSGGESEDGGEREGGGGEREGGGGEGGGGGGGEGEEMYAEETFMTEKEKRDRRGFRKTDAYHLPELEVSLNEMRGRGDDPRVMSLEELESYARHFEAGEDVSVYDFSKIDYDSAFFKSLPASDRYNILNAARLRSRLRMGHSKEQLDGMFPDRMAFSKFQIERVRERNELTQRLMNLNGFQDGDMGMGRVAGERGREYVLVKNEGVEGGWALGVISDEGKREKPIDVDEQPVLRTKEEEDEDEEEEEFEDVPIEGLNRLPKQKRVDDEGQEMERRRRGVYKARKKAARQKRGGERDGNSLFVQSEDDEEEADLDERDGDEEKGMSDEDEDLRAAIAMSLEKDHGEEVRDSQDGEQEIEGADSDNDMLEVFQQSAAAEERPIPRGSGRAIANVVNKRAFNAAPESREITSFGVPTLKPDESDDDDDTMDFQAAIAESRRTKRKATPPRRATPAVAKPASSSQSVARGAGFSGPLPFEKLDLGSSLLGKKKMQQRTEEVAGGFEKPEMSKKQEKKAEPLPPWFAGDVEKDLKAQKAIEDDDRQRAKEFSKQYRFQDRGASLNRHTMGEVIDLDAEEPEGMVKSNEVIDLEDDINEMDNVAAQWNRDDIRMDDMAEKVRAEPPVPERTDETQNVPTAQEEEAEEEEEEEEEGDGTNTIPQSQERRSSIPEPARDDNNPVPEDDAEGSEKLDWSASEDEESGQTNKPATINPSPPRNTTSRAASRSPSAEFEDVTIPNAPIPRRNTPSPSPPVELGLDDIVPEGDEFDDFSDPEEQEMLRALTLEAEEHARFASSLNNRTQAQNVQEYEQELKKLRSQQKKDRRDADEVTHIMITECQQLLRLFGLPYITAPMEAEAQCAQLVSLGLVDGIVTDDSDCFLFGGTRIYKNMFNQAKFVECYLSSDFEKEFDLTRDKMISIAQLLGSDYTEGLPGVGPVTALEIISEFGTLDAFKAWWSGVQTNQISKSDDANNAFRKKFRRNATKLFLPSAFPDVRVQVAYTTPEVDADTQAFQWGVPDLGALRSFLMATIGWSQERTDEVLVPVIRDMNRRLDEGTQSNITAFFEGTVGVGAAVGPKGEAFAPRKRNAGSKRMGSALSRMAERAKVKRHVPTAVDEGDDEGDDHSTAKRRKTKARSATTTAATATEEGGNEANGKGRSGGSSGEGSESDFATQAAKKRRARRSNGGRPRRGRVAEDV